VRFVDSLERYEGTVEELNVAVDGEIGLAWGIHVADFQHKGSPPERTRVRFTMTLRKVEDGQWRTLLEHRDVQQFDENGQYLRAYVRDQ